MHSLGGSRSQTPSPATLTAEHSDHTHSHSHTHLQLEQKLHNSVLQTPDDLGKTHAYNQACSCLCGVSEKLIDVLIDCRNQRVPQ